MGIFQFQSRQYIDLNDVKDGSYSPNLRVVVPTVMEVAPALKDTL